jgi:asparagine synthase (glutamine-hydrolysing)
MCGIAGTFNYAPGVAPVDREELRRMRDHMTLRGPDGSGEWFSQDRAVGLGHRRLSIIDLSANGAQPMVSRDGKYAVTFNGEIYNFQKLRKQLEEAGDVFRSHSDTEVLLHLYRRNGEKMVEQLRGMYAFAIWDSERRSLFLARDPFGIKPLYFADDGKTFRFASQVKALLASEAIDTRPEPAGHVGFFLWGHIPEPFTLYSGIRSLPAGTWMRVEQTGRTTRSYCAISATLGTAEAEAARNGHAISREELKALLEDSVRHHLVADVPVGVFLSAGLDSTTLTSLAAEAGGQMQTVTLGFEEYRGGHNDEVPLAERVAREQGTRQKTVWVTRGDFRQERDALFAAMDQPTIDGVNSYFVSRAARQAGLKVALSGLGGDEIFGGYDSFDQVPKAVRRLAPFNAVPALGRAFTYVTAPLLKRFTSPKYAGLLEYGGSISGAYLLRRGMFMPWELPALLDPDLARAGWDGLQTLAGLDETTAGIRGERLKVSALELSWYMRNQLLRDTDWASMAHSLEVRVPLVDVELLRRLGPWLASGNPPGKRLMASTPARPLPTEVLARSKSGFTVPVREWLVGEQSAVRARGLRGWAQFVYSQLARN